MKQTVLKIPYFLLLIVPLILFSQIILKGEALFWGTISLQFMPWRTFAWHSIQSGHLPLWNPSLGMGAPLLANYQSALFYPPNWLLFLINVIGGIGWEAWGQAVIVALHLAWGGIGMALLTRKLGMRLLAQILCGLSYGLSGYLVARSSFLSVNNSIAWVPWVILGVTNLVLIDLDRRDNVIVKGESTFFQRFLSKWVFPDRLRSLSTLTVVICLQLLAGHAQTSWYTILFAFFWSGFMGWNGLEVDRLSKNFSLKDSWISKTKAISYAWFWILLALIFGILLAGVQILPTAEYLAQSQRSDSVAFDFAMTYSFWPWRFLTLFAPDLFGNPATADYWGYANYWEDALYIGLLPIIMVIFGIFATIFNVDAREDVSLLKSKVNIKRANFVKFLICILLLSFLLALGNNTPLYPWLYNHIPTFDMFQAPTRYTLWAEFSFILLAGLGVEVWKRPEGRALYWARLFTAGTIAISLGAGVTWLMMGDVSPTFIRATTLLGFLGLGIGILTLTNPHRAKEEIDSKRGGVTWRWAVWIFLSLDLLVAGWGLNPGIDRDYYTNDAPTAAEIKRKANDGRLYLSATDEYSLKFDRFMKFNTFDIDEDWINVRAVMLPNLSVLDWIPSVNNFDPLLPERYVRFMKFLNENNNKQDRQKLLNLIGVGVVEVMDSVTGPGDFGVQFIEIKGSARIRWVPCMLAVDSSEGAWQALTSGRIDFDQQVILESVNSLEDVVCEDGITQFKMNVIEDSPNQVSLQTNTDSPGWIVISDVWYPGWSAQVDGIEVPIYKANYLFRAVQITPGDHQIVMSYRPLSFWIGVVISTITGLFILFLVVISGMKSWKSGE